MVPQHIAAVATALTNQAETKQANKEYFSPAVITPIHAIKTALARTIMVVWVAATGRSPMCAVSMCLPSAAILFHRVHMHVWRIVESNVLASVSSLA